MIQVKPRKIDSKAKLLMGDYDKVNVGRTITYDWMMVKMRDTRCRSGGEASSPVTMKAQMTQKVDKEKRQWMRAITDIHPISSRIYPLVLFLVTSVFPLTSSLRLTSSVLIASSFLFTSIYLLLSYCYTFYHGLHSNALLSVRVSLRVYYRKAAHQVLIHSYLLHSLLYKQSLAHHDSELL